MTDITKILSDGFTYSGHPFHMVLNYIVLSLVLVPNLFSRRQTEAWLMLFALFLIIQIALWFTTGAVGISLIWCALAGYNVLQFFIYRKEGGVTLFLLLFSPLIALGAIVFYAVYFPPLTTVAHAIAFVLGIALGLRLRRRFSSYKR